MDNKNAVEKEEESFPPPYQSAAFDNTTVSESYAGNYGAGNGQSAWPAEPPSYDGSYKYPPNMTSSTAAPPTSYPMNPVGMQAQQYVIVQQPMGGGVWAAQPMENPPEDYMCYSIFVTICCCWLIGIFAIIRSSECRSAIAVGDRVTAEMKSREARNKAHLALGLGIGSFIFSVIIFGIYYAMLLNRQSHY